MRPLRQLLSQTAIYGFSTIAVRMLYYMLAPLHTRVFTNQGEYGIISELFAYITFLNVLFMYGMETSFFRFASKSESGIDSNKVFGSAQTSLIISTVIFCSALIISSSSIAAMLSYPGHGEYVVYFALIIGFDCLVNIPFAKLRLAGKPFKYMLYKLMNVSINVLLNCFFLIPALIHKPDMFGWLGYHYHESMGVSYVFIANLVASAITFVVFIPSMLNLKFDIEIWKRLMRYGSPLIIIGLAGMVNETLDRILLKYFLPGTLQENLVQLGIYSAAYKLSIFMTLAVQGFRMGAEPFFFAQSQEKNAPKLYADIMKYFVIACCFIFLGVGMFLDVFKVIIGKDYWSGLYIVPILLMANLFLGMYYNQSVWYKLTDKTGFATNIALAGAAITLLLNWLLIPLIGYEGSAWATFACYGSMVIMSWRIGQKYYYVPYNLRKILLYLISATILCLVGNWLMHALEAYYWLNFSIRISFLAVFFALAWWMDVGDIARNLRKT